MSGTKYITRKLCLNCNEYTDYDKASCSFCGHLFTEEATDHEIRDANMRYERANHKERVPEDNFD